MTSSPPVRRTPPRTGARFLSAATTAAAATALDLGDDGGGGALDLGEGTRHLFPFARRQGQRWKITLDPLLLQVAASNKSVLSEMNCSNK
uniref:Uncharacterized protein n=1 Tax=Arundo donax TaxID=35708 RepID=A0A0A9D4V1_ARUDO